VPRLVACVFHALEAFDVSPERPALVLQSRLDDDLLVRVNRALVLWLGIAG
jgi:hypothetical protein